MAKKVNVRALIILGTLAGLLAHRTVTGAQAQPPVLTAAVAGTVNDAATGEPLEGARVSLAALGLAADTDSQGQFGWHSVTVPSAIFTATVVVEAAGYGTWTLADARLVANDTLVLTAALSQDALTIHAPAPRAQQPDWHTGGVTALPASPETAQPLPETIRVRVTGYAHCDTSRPYTVETIDFRDYVKHVLPNEWIASWHGESLRAGAMAAKSYAWYWAARGGKWPDADVYDSTCDQVYNPAVAYASTNAAVDATWNWRITRNGLLFQTSYRAHYSQCTNAGLAGNCMGQWDSKWMADQGLGWQEILAYFYQDSAVALIDPPVDNFALRFHGNAQGEADRLTIRVDDPATSTAGPRGGCLTATAEAASASSACPWPGMRSSSALAAMARVVTRCAERAGWLTGPGIMRPWRGGGQTAIFGCGWMAGWRPRRTVQTAISLTRMPQCRPAPAGRPGRMRVTRRSLTYSSGRPSGRQARRARVLAAGWMRFDSPRRCAMQSRLSQMGRLARTARPRRCITLKTRPGWVRARRACATRPGPAAGLATETANMAAVRRDPSGRAPNGNGGTGSCSCRVR